MGLPRIDITFTALTRTALLRSGRGVTAVLLEDYTGEPVYLTSGGDITALSLSAASRDALRMALGSGSARVLAAGVSGSDAAAYTGALEAIASREWNWLAAPFAGSAGVTALYQGIKAARAAGQRRKAVLAGEIAPDSEGIVVFPHTTVTSSYLDAGTAVTYTGAAYTPRLAGLLAGLALNRSATGLALEDVLDCSAIADEDAAVDAGKLVLTLQGGDYAIARGVTSQTDPAKPAPFRKIKLVEGADLLAEDMALIFRSLYRGQRLNTYANKQQLVADYLGYFSGLMGTVLNPDGVNTVEIDTQAVASALTAAGRDISEMTQAQLARADTGEAVYLLAHVTLADAMEDLTLEIVLD